jgi:hypothetical protein
MHSPLSPPDRSLHGRDPSPQGGALSSSGPDSVLPEFDTSAERDRRFVGMLRAFRSTGGLLRGDEVSELISYHRQSDASQSISRLARQIATREVVSFEWRGERWLPLFQFQLSDMSLREPVRQVAAELAPVMDGWALANWFATANAWLGQRTPVEALKDDVSSVIQAARAERYVALGDRA